jgi:pyrroline-5-carboxylate reductase
MKKKIGIIGYGNMGSAISERIKEKYEVYVFDKDKNKTANLTAITACGNLVDLLKGIEIVLLGVKPQDLDDVLNKIKGYVKDKLIISIVAGIPTSYIERVLDKARIIRAMPNMGAKIGQSVTCLCKGLYAADSDFMCAAELFNYLGVARKLEENLMNAATAISGSGPAYYFNIIESNSQAYKDNPNKVLKDFINSLTKSAEGIGFDRRDAKTLAIHTAYCAQALLDKTGLSPAELKRQVTSRGGTTEAALDVLDQGGSLEEAVKAARGRAEELAKGGVKGWQK